MANKKHTNTKKLILAYNMYFLELKRLPKNNVRLVFNVLFNTYEVSIFFSDQFLIKYFNQIII